MSDESQRLCAYCGESSPVCFGGFRNSACSFRYEELRSAAERAVETYELGYAQTGSMARLAEMLRRQK